MVITKFSDVLEQCMPDKQDVDNLKVDAPTSAAVLLVAVIKADGVVDRLEFAEVIDILGRRFQMSAGMVGRLLEGASDSVSMQYDLEVFTQYLRDQWSHDERRELLKNFWEIAIADNLIDDRETTLIEKLAKLLNLTAEEITDARALAEQQLEFQQLIAE